MTFKKNIAVCCLVAGFSFAGLGNAYAYGVDAYAIYRQAQKKNHKYFQVLKRYDNIIDLKTRTGDTAYCLALKGDDKDALEMLEKYGANEEHECVKRFKQKNKVVEKKKIVTQKKQAKTKKFIEEDNSGTYLWTGLGVLAVGGGIAAIAGSGGGGSSNGSVNTGSGDGNGGQGGNTDGNKSDVEDTPWDDADKRGEFSQTVKDVDKSEFETSEYKKGNFLDGINASVAYAKIYKKDENGELVGQSADKDWLKVVRVGVLDTGVYANEDLSGKVGIKYDINGYNDDNSLWGYTKDNTEFYVFKRKEGYYLVTYTLENGIYNVSAPMDENDLPEALTLNEVKAILKDKLGVSFSDFTVMNGGGLANPGAKLDADLTDKNLWAGLLFGNIHEFNHGTHVAGIIAANKDNDGMHGVAFDNAEIVAASWDMQQGYHNVIKDMIREDVSVFNMSWGYSDSLGVVPTDNKEDYFVGAKNFLKIFGEDALKSYAEVAKNKAVWVQAAGNDSMRNMGYVAEQPVVNAAMGGMDLSDYGYKGAGKLEAPMIVVGAIDPSTATSTAIKGKISSFSNNCGYASDYCLVAPGSDMYSTGAFKDGEVYIDGTSMAAPVVSGSIALLNGYYPWLNAQNIAYLLLETANDSGDYANKEIYGQGVLDLDSAVSTPLGDVGLPSKASFDSLSSAKASKIALSSTMQGGMTKAMPEKITVFDALNRPFDYDTSKLISKTHSSNANLRNTVSRMAMAGAKKTIKDERSGFQFTTTEALNNGGVANLATAEVINEADIGSSRFYYAENSKYDKTDSVLAPSSNPYFAMNDAYGAENIMNLSDVSKLKLSIQTGENGLYERDYEQDKHSFDERAYAMSAEYSFNMTDYLEVATLGGMLYENDAVLGMNGVGALGIKDSSTYYMGIKTALNITNNLSIMAAYYRGYTKGADASLLAVSDLQTESFMLAGEYKLNKKDKIGLSLSSPLSVVKGRASFNYATGRDNYSDTIYMNKLTTSLKPEAKEYDLGLYYMGEPKEDINLTGKVEARFNADGEKGLTDYIGVLGVSASF